MLRSFFFESHQNIEEVFFQLDAIQKLEFVFKHNLEFCFAKIQLMIPSLNEAQCQGGGEKKGESIALTAPLEDIFRMSLTRNYKKLVNTGGGEEHYVQRIVRSHIRRLGNVTVIYDMPFPEEEGLFSGTQKPAAYSHQHLGLSPKVEEIAEHWDAEDRKRNLSEVVAASSNKFKSS